MIKTAKELAAACLDVAKNYKTLYVMGCFGWPMNDYNKQRAIREHPYNRNSAGKINAASADTFGFDCVNLIKALLWGWVGDVTAPYGGAIYSSNGVPDINDDMMIAACNEISTDFSKIATGEVVWMQGHIGVYVGDGLVVECTPIWGDGVQITACNCDKAGYNRRDWVKHGKLPYVTYEAAEEPELWYRIRKSWEDAASQIGAYKEMEYAKANCPVGYSVFDWNGKAVYTNKPESTTYTLTLPVLKKGNNGKTVKALQHLLIANGIKLPMYGADSDFGAETENGVKEYQRKVGLSDDGVVGPNTMSSLIGV